MITNLGDILHVTTLHALAAVAADADGTALDLADYDGEIAVIVVNSAGSQDSTTDRTMAMKIKECATSGGSYTDVADGALTGLTTAAGTQKLSLNSDNLQRYIKINFDIAGTGNPTYNIAAVVAGVKKNPA